MDLTLDYDEEHPWTRQPCDNEQSWAAFVVYRDSPPPRYLRDVSAITGANTRTLRTWCEEDGWELRVAAYDRWLDEVRSNQVAAIVGEDAMARAARHIGLLRGMQEIAAATVADWVRRVRKGEVIVDSPRDLAKIAKDAIMLERLVYGESTVNASISTSRDLSRLSLEELEQLRALEAKAEGG